MMRHTGTSTVMGSVGVGVGESTAGGVKAVRAGVEVRSRIVVPVCQQSEEKGRS
jgi:hypothetical protein